MAELTIEQIVKIGIAVLVLVAVVAGVYLRGLLKRKLEAKKPL